MPDATDTSVYIIVLALRLLVPLAIPRFPLPTILASLLLDGVDRGIFAVFTDLDLENYQTYDKALDVYYLTIAYLSAMRNWTNLDAVRAGRFLLYYRLVGALLFELTGNRALLLVFPNTFEYFFIAYEIYALRWNPNHISRKAMIGAVAIIWVGIKLPQEYWIHIAQRDASDFLVAHPPLIAVLAVLIVLLIVGTRWALTHRLPPAERRPVLRASSPFQDPRYRDAMREMINGRLLDDELLEKVVLISLVSVIFSQMLPNVRSTPMQMALGVSILLASNTAVSEWLSRRKDGWKSMTQYFIVVAVLNTGLSLTFLWLLPMQTTSIPLARTLFFLLLITLLINYYDSYRPSYLMRSNPPL